MTITSTSYTVKNGAWKQASSGRAELGARSETHAEIVAYQGTPARNGVVLLEIDGFPCETCHERFKAESKRAGNGPIIVYVTANKGSYSTAHFKDKDGKPSLNGSVPCVIYYLNGEPSYVTTMTAIANKGKSSAPAGMPDFPAYNAFVTKQPIQVDSAPSAS